jgi:SAM-dependent methyltransferase
MSATDPTYALGSSHAEHQRLVEQAALFRPMTERLFRQAGIGPGMRVLDIGSGAGDVAFLAAELVGATGEVVGIDTDGAALAKARARAELLGLTNVSFIEGDARSAERDGLFDAAIGRLVLMYMADPGAGLRAVADGVRSGGILAFQELDMDADVSSRSYPAGTLWDETGRRIIETFGRAGVRVRMGRQLLSAFSQARLPIPTLTEEALVGGGPDFGGYAWIADTMRSLAPLAEKLGIATTADLGLDTLASRIRDDAVALGAMVWSPPVVGAYARNP